MADLEKGRFFETRWSYTCINLMPAGFLGTAYLSASLNADQYNRLNRVIDIEQVVDVPVIFRYQERLVETGIKVVVSADGEWLRMAVRYSGFPDLFSLIQRVGRQSDETRLTTEAIRRQVCGRFRA